MSYVKLPPEAGHPPFIAARLKKPASGMNDAPRRWWKILNKALRSNSMVPTRADRCCYVLYSLQSLKQAWEHWGQRTIAQQNGTTDAFTKTRERSEINLFVDDIFGTGGNDMEQRVLARLRKCFQVGSEDRCELHRTKNSLDTRFPKRAVR